MPIWISLQETKNYRCMSNDTKDINKAVNQHLDILPEDFYFQLTDEEYDNLKFQIGTSKVRGRRRYNPYVFTEHYGTSINRIGYKTFSINLISDKEVCNLLISKVNKII